MSKNTANQLSENRVFKPAKEFSKKARIQSMAQYHAPWFEPQAVLGEIGVGRYGGGAACLCGTDARPGGG